jgi:hypothetical protein
MKNLINTIEKIAPETYDRMTSEKMPLEKLADVTMLGKASIAFSEFLCGFNLRCGDMREYISSPELQGNDDFLHLVNTQLWMTGRYLAEAEYRPAKFTGFISHRVSGIMYQDKSRHFSDSRLDNL